MSGGLLSGVFWKAALERATRTAAQAAGAALIADATGLFDTDWLGVLSVVVMAALLSLLMSIGGNAATGHGPAIAGPETVDGGGLHNPGTSLRDT